MDQRLRRQLAAWLFVCAAMVLVTLVIGGVTRLTHAGLSIVEWQPLVGVLPPLDAAAWQTAFEQYRGTPEYRQVNAAMSLGEFQRIFWWEYAHRLAGRAVGVAFLLPFLYWLLRRRLRRPLVARLAAIFALGALQGALGWYMVQSGLVDDPRVSQYRLTAHLSLAFVIFAAMVWVALGLLRKRAPHVANRVVARLRAWALWLPWLVAYMVISGGFVAGLRAGKAYNSFPLMNGELVPTGILMLEPWYLNLFNNLATVQFNHRLGAWLLAGVVPWFWWQLRAAPVTGRVRNVATMLLVALAVQIALGIATLLLAVPVALGAAHQGGAMVVFGLALWLNHELRAVQVGDAY